MARPHSPPAAPPPCYATVHPGLEEVAGDEITRDLRGEVKKSSRGVVVFRVPDIDPDLLRLRTTEDVFLLAWGSDALTYRAADLDKIQRWTAREADWPALLRYHHAVRPLPKGRPTFRLVVQMEGKHAYRRADARTALARGLVGKIPASWLHVDENAAVEVWLSIDNTTAVCGVRLSDRDMRHRTYKLEHRPASLRPTLAAAMVRLAGVNPTHAVLDPMCGAGTLLAEHLAVVGRMRVAQPGAVLGGDLEHGAARAAAINLRRLGACHVSRWDAARLPLADEAVDRVLCNPPFGKQLETPESVGPLYRRLMAEAYRVARPGGRAVVLVGDAAALREAAQAAGWQAGGLTRLRILGQPAVISVWRKAGG